MESMTAQMTVEVFSYFHTGDASSDLEINVATHTLTSVCSSFSILLSLLLIRTSSPKFIPLRRANSMKIWELHGPQKWKHTGE